MKTFDAEFINSAYISEIWAAADLKKRLADGMGPRSLIEDQIDDEERHAHMLLKALENEGFPVIHSLKFAMQNVIHVQAAGISLAELDSRPQLFWAFHEIMERRALWNYRTSLVGRIRAPFREILKMILKDEKDHLVNRPLYPDDPTVIGWKRRDDVVFKDLIRKRYNNLDLLRSEEFWRDYFGSGLQVNLLSDGLLKQNPKSVI